MGLAVAILTVFIVLGLITFEYRLRNPDELILREVAGGIKTRSGLLYPRHFSLPLKRTSHGLHLSVDASAAGNLGLRVKVSGAVTLCFENLDALIRAGGWSSDAVAKAADEFVLALQALAKEFTEHQEIAKISSAKLLEHLNSRISISKTHFGLEVISLAVLSIDPIDPAIAESLRQQEHARILEQTELLNNQARTAAARAKVKADEEIAVLENQAILKKAELEKARLLKEAELANQRLDDELKRSRARLQFEREELELIKSSPELLMLTPQAARLAEASQHLRNARTIVSLSPQDVPEGPELMGMFQNFLKKALESKKV